MMIDTNHSRLSEFARIGHQDKNEIYVTVRPTHACNFACDYCDAYDNGHPSRPDLTPMYEFVEFLGSRKQDIKIYFHGGEPTLHAGFGEFVRRLCQVPSVSRIYIGTNLSVSDSQLREVLCEHAKLFFICSFHYKTLPTTNAFFRRLDLLDKGAVDYVVPVMMHIDYFQQLYDLWQMSRYRHVFRRIWQHVGRYSEHQEKVFEAEEPVFKAAFQDGTVHAMTMNEVYMPPFPEMFKGMWCESGQKNLVIDWSMEVYLCQSHMSSGQPGLMNLLRDPHRKYDQFDKPCVCHFQQCQCIDKMRRYRR